MKEFTIGKNEAGKRFDKYLFIILSNSSSGFIYKMLRKKNITLNDKKADGKEKLSEGDIVKLYLSDETFEKFADKKIVALMSDGPDKKASNEAVLENNDNYLEAFKKIEKDFSPEIIYEDSEILLVNKPAGLLSQKAVPSDVSINEWLIGYLLEEDKISSKQLVTFKPSICNRLDRNTSGIVICSKSLAGAQKMNELLKDRNVHKFYRTIVRGVVTSEMTIDGYLVKDERNNTVTISDTESEDSSHIVTRYIPLKTNEAMNLSYIEVELITGKSHQIRAHLSSIGHPIIGDSKYGNIKFNSRFKKDYGLKYQLLHSYRLQMPKMTDAFIDISEKTFVAKLPDIFNKLLKDNNLN